MIAYKATRNFKCINQEYKVGKTYTADKMKICHYGFHFCQEMHNVLKYYQPTNDFVLLEIEVLGAIETEYHKSVTDKFKVLRVVPREEYTDAMNEGCDSYKYDENNNLISIKFSSRVTSSYEYDERGNCISQKYSDDDRKTVYEYDERNNRISTTYPDGRKSIYEYDERGNRISETNSTGYKWRFGYDDRNNMVSATYPSGTTYEYEYDDQNNQISITCDGVKTICEVAIITEE